ncbi:zinc carboxypeptidase-like [Pieris brassicae]|uniref:zinc carboxypeptidase-like n=1 Tax=Pieris brassicae TaxID=7116 RepID=UPI001E65E406|nr:zinc carboxypeptidase-like [Pieris brassicae]
MKIFLLLLFVGFLEVLAQKQTFEGYKVYKINPKTENDVEFIKKLQNNGIGELWEDQVHVNYEVRVMVPPENVHLFLENVNKENIDAQELISDMQSIIDNQLLPDAISRNSANASLLSMTWDRYYDLDDINKWLDELVINYPGIVKNVSMGTSFEKRDIRGIVINYKPEREEKLIGMLEGTLHAREWISTAVVNWIIKELLTSKDPVIRGMAENIEWHIFPVVNPDGYVYTFTTNRMWRKNRNTRNFTSCGAVSDDMSNGIDLNRNFDFAWMTVGVSSNPCSNTFAGSAPASEPETQAIVNYVRSIKDQGKFIYYYSFHSYTQLIIVPYSNGTSADVLQVDNYGDMFEIAARGAAKAKERYGTVYRFGIAADVLYVMSGSSFDWVKQETGVSVSYLIELRDMGDFGFLLPASQIIPNSLEIVDCLVEMDKVTRRLGYYSGANTFVSSLSLIILCIMFYV